MIETLMFSRYFVAGVAGALLTYWLYWAVIGWRAKQPDVSPRGAVFSARLQAGAAGYWRLYFGWVIAFTVYGLIATYDARPFTWDWWYNAIFDGDWVVILVAPLFFAYAQWRRAAGKRSSCLAVAVERAAVTDA